MWWISGKFWGVHTSICACKATAELEPTANQTALLRRGVRLLPPEEMSHSNWLHSHPPWTTEPAMSQCRVAAVVRGAEGALSLIQNSLMGHRL